ncbi:MAG: NADH-ubiquinone oxidoreductase-F iron-sulfur binding region domain-containing protein [Thermodesulfobacteriota bacterium]
MVPSTAAHVQAGSPAVSRFTVCSHPKCDRGSAQVRGALILQARLKGIPVRVEYAPTACPGTCQSGPFVGMPELGLFYQEFPPEEAPLLLEETALHGRILFRRLRIRAAIVTDARVAFEQDERVLVTIGEEIPLLDAAAYLFFFNAKESCGKCFPCRIGVPEAGATLSRILSGKAQEKDLKEFQTLISTMADSSYCRFAAKVTASVRTLMLHQGKEIAKQLTQPVKRILTVG